MEGLHNQKFTARGSQNPLYFMLLKTAEMYLEVAQQTIQRSSGVCFWSFMGMHCLFASIFLDQAYNMMLKLSTYHRSLLSCHDVSHDLLTDLCFTMSRSHGPAVRPTEGVLLRAYAVVGFDGSGSHAPRKHKQMLAGQNFIVANATR